MADNKKTMNSSVFERLHNRFFECRKEIKRGKTLSDWDISDVMFTAGKALFAAISSKEIDLGDTPDWFAIEPEGTRIGDNGKGGCKDFVVYSWDLYWLSVIKWLAKNKPDSGITFSGDIHRVKPENYLHSGEDVVGLLMVLLRLRGEHLKRACSRLARASEDACLYLARKAVKEPAEIEKDTALGILGRIRIWLKNHPHSYGLQGGIIFLVLFLSVGLFKPQWRQWCWGIAGLAFLVLLLSLLGGRSRK